MPKRKHKTKIIISLIGLIIFFLALVYFLFLKDRQDFTYHALKGADDLDLLISQAADSSYVLLGEASHGNAEYYQWREIISQRLITEHGFDFIIVEGDWDALYQINLYVKHLSHPEGGAKEILKTFERWPTWMWANHQFLSLVEWLRQYNADLAPEDRVGIYGKDIYGLNNSMLQLIDYLEGINSALATEVEELYSCLLVYQDDFSAYINDIFYEGVNCQSASAQVLAILEDEPLTDKDYFKAKQDALVVIYGEEHYRNNIYSQAQAWNSRVRGMKKIFDNLLNYYGPGTRAIVWAHNTHIGDARATSMAENNMVNIGQLLREEHGREDVYIIGFGSFSGTVMAASAWGEAGRVLMIPPAQTASLEDYLFNLPLDDFYILLNQNNLPLELSERIGHRAKGVVYNPQQDDFNYVPTILKDRYDAFIFLERSTSLRAL